MFAKAFHYKSVLRGAVFAAAGLALAACSSVYRKHGYVPTPGQLAEVVPGIDTRDSVAETIGVPTSTGVLNDSGYYYVATRFRHYGAAAPEPVARDLVAISFDAQGVVEGIRRYSLEDGKVVPLERRVTSSGVEDSTFLRQLLGNLGNFGPSQILNTE
ncbi:outer membrane protein assembly factor BamE [Leisingera caerulea]|uniref:Outer membrane protein assembly factor BamE n=1 Tax=Leisingera caerulea TaxID=506591 RepID=A0A9Q9HGJ1_LEICA|nr:outer membrane protein assembly factor BamE [Leisingera caerulea]UWQ48331.1 outer membrane protein assembly factor BamE [Leisingera caerulea]UWQ52411.1 outer membrane protein assembly factor BamE [Leisingera caerulea]UWQ56963.1 outer membrane protein assembly factor BamE [Leisingera caerulea]UWQ61240.1 outer membrane protein assembly factor BamE [Leisingera caerulea]UWQ82103.1 outer membrane protein assembly factor BamE [Leisingera caerulea]